jgi:hypothetical protein
MAVIAGWEQTDPTAQSRTTVTLPVWTPVNSVKSKVSGPAVTDPLTEKGRVELEVGSQGTGSPLEVLELQS